MSKKKRNRRPPSSPASPSAPITSERVATAEPVAAEPELDAAIAAELPAAVVEGVEPAQAVAMAQVEPTDDGLPPAPAPAADAMPAVGVLPSWSSEGSGDIRGVLIQVAGGRLLLPNATIAEVLSYAEPEAEASDADWLLGRFRWRGWQLPLIAFSRLAGIGEDKPGLGSKVIVLKALGGDRRIPYFAIVTQGFPRLVTVSRSALEVDGGVDALPTAVQAFVRLNDEPALLPDLLQIEQRLREVREAA